ncbi:MULTISPECIES: hypothetical protein [Halonotius]|nr:hypothetical protein [Halonotius aquaticus]
MTADRRSAVPVVGQRRLRRLPRAGPTGGLASSRRSGREASFRFDRR